MDELTYLQSIGNRFHGVSLEFRRSGTGWPAAWRARLLTNKNEREAHRLECFGATPQQAIEALRQAVEQADRPG